MNTQKGFVPILIIILLFFPTFVFAAWWNPLSWFGNWSFLGNTSNLAINLDDSLENISKSETEIKEDRDTKDSFDIPKRNTQDVAPKTTQEVKIKDVTLKQDKKPIFNTQTISPVSSIAFEKNYNNTNYYRLNVTGANNSKIKWFLNVDCPQNSILKVNGSSSICNETLILSPTDNNGNLTNVEISIKNNTDNPEKITFWIKAYDEYQNLLTNFSKEISYGETTILTTLSVVNSGSDTGQLIVDGDKKKNVTVQEFYIVADGDITLKELKSGIGIDTVYGRVEDVIEGIHLYDKQTEKIYSISSIGSAPDNQWNNKIFTNLNINLKKGQKYNFALKVDIKELQVINDKLNYWDKTYLKFFVEVDLLRGAVDLNLNKIWTEPGHIYKTIELKVTDELRQEWMG